MDSTDKIARPSADGQDSTPAEVELVPTSSRYLQQLQWSAEAIHRSEQLVYAAIGLMLVLALMVALAGSAKLLWDGVQDWTGTDVIFRIIDRLLFVLMLVEILHTVHASIRTGALHCEPFLVVALIACIRRILVITLETSQITKSEHWDASNLPLFNASMIELGVLGMLIIVLVGSIWLTRTSRNID